MKIGSITNQDVIALAENATELFKLGRYRSKEFVEDYIGLGIHRSGFYGTYNPITDEATAIPRTRTNFDQDDDVNLLVEGVVVVNNAPINIGAGDIVYWGRGFLVLADGTPVYDGAVAGVIWGGIAGNITDQTDLVAYVTAQINSALVPIDSRITNLENNIHEVTYAETIDISSGTSGSIAFPTGATLDSGDFPQGAVLSTQTGGEIDFKTPINAGTPIAATLDSLGNWTTTNTFTTPVKLIFRLRISGVDYSNLDNNKVIDMWLSEDLPSHASTHENGGSDEINVGGLSGVLADPQTPVAHTHTASEITDFDTEVSNNPSVVANTAKVSADGSVTTHSDVTDAGSGQIITGAERTKLAGIEANAKDDQNASEVPVSPAVNGETDVQAALEDHETRIDSVETSSHAAVTLNSDDATQQTLNLAGQEIQVNQASPSTDGAMSAEDKTKLDSLSTEAYEVYETGTTNISGVATIVDFDTERAASTFFSLAGGVITVNTAVTKIVLHYSVSLDRTINDRSTASSEVYLNGTLYPGSTSFSYHRTIASGEGSCVKTVTLNNLSIGNTIDVRSTRISGGATDLVTVADGSNIVIEVKQI